MGLPVTMSVFIPGSVYSMPVSGSRTVPLKATSGRMSV